MATGAFTPTEAAIAACAWALFIGAVFDPLTSMLERRGHSYNTIIGAMTALLAALILVAAVTRLKLTDAIIYAFGLNMLACMLAFMALRAIDGDKVKRALNFARFYNISIGTIETTASVLIIVGAASLFGWVLTTTRVTEAVAEAMLSVTTNPLMILLIINVILLVVGCFMETIAAISILVPVLMPIVNKVGIDPVQFGLIMVLNLMIGLLTPPVGMVLFVLSRVANLSFDRTVAAVMPFLLPLFVVLILITVFPQLTLWLPTLIYR
jgi:TRAP-type C4-dicarboxylate transport system permease large subunit